MLIVGLFCAAENLDEILLLLVVKKLFYSLMKIGDKRFEIDLIAFC